MRSEEEKETEELWYVITDRKRELTERGKQKQRERKREESSKLKTKNVP